MGDVYVPPLPPQTPQPPAGYDFLRPFVFLFDDPRWLPKTMMGGLFILLSTLLIGVPFVLGYFAKTIRNVIAGMALPLPEWDELGEYFNEGLLLFGVWLVYMLPITFLSIAANIGAAIFQNVDQNAVRDIGTTGFAFAQCIFSVISFALSLFVPAAILMVIVTRRFGAGFEISKIWTFITTNVGNYLLAIISAVIASIVSLPGVILCCVGLAFTMFWAHTVSAHAMGQVYRNSPLK